jgi:hypothetical protein
MIEALTFVMEERCTRYRARRAALVKVGIAASPVGYWRAHRQMVETRLADALV